MPARLRHYWTISLLLVTLPVGAPQLARAADGGVGEVRLSVPANWIARGTESRRSSWELTTPVLAAKSNTGTARRLGIAQLVVDPNYYPLARLTPANLVSQLCPAALTAAVTDAERVEIAGVEGYRLHLQETTRAAEPVHHVFYVLSGRQTVILSLTTPASTFAEAVAELDRAAASLEWTQPLTFAMPPWFCASLLGILAGCSATLRGWWYQRRTG